MKCTWTVLLLWAVATAGCGDPDVDASPFAGCAHFEELSTDPAEISFGRTGAVYEPKCASVRVGQRVMFSGNFSIHPLKQVFGPVEALFAKEGGKDPFVVQVDTPGRYGYYCRYHGTEDGKGMAGAIEVLERGGESP